MAIKNRTTLKSYFTKNSIPTEGNFADLIDATLNLADDGIAKSSNSPLSIEAAGADDANSEKRTLSLFQKMADPNPAWTVSLRSPDTTRRPGLSISDGSSNNRLFIDSATGNLGVGTVAPTYKLHVVNTGGFGGEDANGISLAGGVPLVAQASGTVFGILNAEGRQAFALNINDDLGTKAARGVPVFHDKYDGTWHAALALKLGNVGIGTTAPQSKLHINLIEAETQSQFGAINIDARASTYEQVLNGAFVQIRRTSPPPILQAPSIPGGGGGVVFPGGGVALPGFAGNVNIPLVAAAAAGPVTSTLFYIRGDGNVGIGNDSPKDLLEVSGNIRTLRLRLGDKWMLSGVGDVNQNDDWLRLYGTGTPTPSGLSTPSPANNYYGGFAAAKLWSNTGALSGSDIQLKHHIQTLEHPIEDVLQLRGIRFQWKSDGADGKHQLGLVAQEVESVFPELVEIGPDGLKGVNYSGLFAPLIEAIKVQQQQITELRAEIESLKNN